MALTVETKVWEKDWRFILKQGSIKKVMLGLGRSATKRLLLINNVDRPTEVARYADQLIHDGILDDYVFVDDYASAALNFFKISKEDLGKGYYYSIAELVSIYLCETDYLAHFSGDTIAQDSMPLIGLIPQSSCYKKGRTSLLSTSLGTLNSARSIKMQYFWRKALLTVMDFRIKCT